MRFTIKDWLMPEIEDILGGCSFFIPVSWLDNDSAVSSLLTAQ